MNFIKLLLYGGVEKEDYKRIEKDIWRENRRNQIVFYSVMSAILFILCLLSYNSGIYGREYWLFFLIVAGILLVLSFVTLFVTPNKVISEVTVVGGFAMAYAAAIYISCVLENDRVSVSFIVLLVLLPQLVSGRPLSMIIRTLLAVVSFIFCNLIYCSGKVLALNILNAVIFGLLILILATVTMKGNIQRYIDEYKLRYIGDIDILTGVNNRNSYEQSLNRYDEICKGELNCIYIDLNGLHELNNTKGHDAGDVAIRSVADELKQNFRQSDIYRIGGDEFVVFAADADSSSIVERIDECRKNLLKKDVYISYGVKNMKKEELDMKSLVKDAEALMFEAKENYYKESGLKHR